MRDGDGQFWLETPIEKGRIDVEDAPFVAVEMTASGSGSDQQIRFRTNLDEWVTAGAAQPIHVTTDPMTEAPSPYVRVRKNLDALIVRSVFYDLVELGVETSGGQGHMLGVWSGGAFFRLGKTA